MSKELWENIFINKEWGKYPNEHLIRFIARNFYNIPNRKDIHILELGLGTGANLWFCAREGFSVSGIEWSKSGVDRFLKRVNDEGLNSFIKEIKIGDYFEKLDEFEDESFDAILDCASLCCNDFNKTKIIFDKAIKKLKTKGKFLSITLGDELLGFDKDKGFEQIPYDGIYTKLGMLRFSDNAKIDNLYNNKNFKKLSLSTSVLERDGVILDKLFILEGEKI